MNAATTAAVLALTLDDLRTCPNCGTVGWWLQEVGKRPSWQAMRLRVDAEHGIVEDEYLGSEEGDDVAVDHFECRDCGWTWETLHELEKWLVAARNARADAAILPVEASDVVVTNPVGIAKALCAVVTNTRARAILELHDPQLLEQARTALGLVEVTS